MTADKVLILVSEILVIVILVLKIVQWVVRGKSPEFPVFFLQLIFIISLLCTISCTHSIPAGIKILMILIIIVIASFTIIDAPDN